MEPEDSLPSSQELATSLYLEPDASNPHLPHLISPRTILKLSSYVRLFLPRSLPFRFPDQNLVCNSHLSHVCYMPRPSYPPWLDYPKCIWRSVQVTKLLIMQSSPASRHFLVELSSQSVLNLIIYFKTWLWFCLFSISTSVTYIYTRNRNTEVVVSITLSVYFRYNGLMLHSYVWNDEIPIAIL
jgi:hypothetical protein